MQDHIRYYEIAGITVQVESDLPFTETTFHQKFESFRVDGPGDDTVVIRHHFGLPESIPGRRRRKLLQEIYRKPPWAIYRAGESWIYQVSRPNRRILRCTAWRCSPPTTRVGDIYNTHDLRTGMAPRWCAVA